MYMVTVTEQVNDVNVWTNVTLRLAHRAAGPPSHKGDRQVVDGRHESDLHKQSDSFSLVGMMVVMTVSVKLFI